MFSENLIFALQFPTPKNIKKAFNLSEWFLSKVNVLCKARIHFEMKKLCINFFRIIKNEIAKKYILRKTKMKQITIKLDSINFQTHIYLLFKFICNVASS